MGPSKPRTAAIDPFAAYLRERVTAYPGLTGRQLFRETKEREYFSDYTAVTGFLRDVWPPQHPVLRFGSRCRPASRNRSISPSSRLCSLASRQPKDRIFTLTQPGFIKRNEAVHSLESLGIDKSHLAAALGAKAVKAGKSVYF